MRKTKTNSVDRDTIRIFWRAGALSKRWFVVSLLTPLGVIFLSVVTPYLIGKSLAALTQPHGDPLRYLVLFGIAGVVGLLLNRIGFTRLMWWQAKTMAHLQAETLEVLLKRGASFHNNNVSGKLVSDAIDFPNAFSQLSGSVLNNMLPLAVVLVAGTVVIFVNSWQLGILTLLMIIFTIGTGVFDQRRRMPLRKRRMAANKKMIAHLADSITNVHTIKTFSHEPEELAHNITLSNELRDLRITDWSSAARQGNNRIMVLLIFQAVIALTTIGLVHRNPGLLAAGIFTFSFTITISNRLFQVNEMVRNTEDAFLQAEPMTRIMQEDIEIKDAPGAKKLVVSKGAVTFNDITFRYQDDNIDQAVFENLRLDIRPGEKIGLVGPSGGGKSTFTRLLLRFEDVEGGTITIDGQDIASVTQASLRQHISYVPQEPLMFHRTVRENITYGNPEATDGQVAKAAQAAHADDFIASLPKGYETIVGERGVKLSGGQRQRIAIARAILKDAPILVLDEATSALDSESEVLIQDALWKLMEGRTAIVIAHRLSTIQKMDRIVVLDHGKIVEQGKHAELLQQKGLYAKLWAHQSGGFIEE